MPVLRCKRSLDSEMAALGLGNIKSQSPTKKLLKRKLNADDVTQSPAKRTRSQTCEVVSRTSSSSDGESTPDSLATKSFYGGGTSKYVGPLERRKQRELLGSKNTNLKGIENIPVPARNPETTKGKKQSKSKNTSNKQKKQSKSTPLQRNIRAPNKVLRKTSGGEKGSSSDDLDTFLTAQKEYKDEISEKSKDTPEKNANKKFFRHRISPGEKAKHTSPQILLRKGYKVPFKKSKASEKTVVNAEAVPVDTNSSEKVPKSRKRAINNSLLASLSTIRKLKTNCSSLSDSLSVASEDPPSQDMFEVVSSVNLNDTESILESICDEIEAASFDCDVTSADSACHLQSASLPSDVSSETNVKSSSPDSAKADSVMLLSELSSEKSLSALNTPTCSPRDPNKKLFAIFRSSPRSKRCGSLTSSPVSSVLSTPGDRSKRPAKNNILKNLRDRDGKEQMILDFGQKLDGPKQCETCGMPYTAGEPTDEHTHSKFHQTLVSALKFPGWKKERVCQDNPDGSRIVVVTPQDKFASKKIEAIRQIVDNELGFVVERRKLTPEMKIFLYVSEEKKVTGCCIADSIKKGYRMIGSSQSADSDESAADTTWCCSTKPEAAKCGISRIWVLASERRKQIASQLLDCVRCHFLMGYPLKKTDLAFSDPTPSGRQFAIKYTGSSRFLVYKHNGGQPSQ